MFRSLNALYVNGNKFLIIFSSPASASTRSDKAKDDVPIQLSHHILAARI